MTSALSPPRPNVWTSTSRLSAIPIAKLRSSFGDPLFVREGGRQVPTQRCERLLAQTSQMLDLLDQMAQPQVFDPQVSTQSVTIACNYYERILLIPRIIAELRRQAPNMSVNVINALGDGHHRLLQQEADVLVGPFTRSGSGFHSRRLYSEEYACLMDPGHPMAGRRLTVDEYLSLKHVLINYGGGWKSAYLQQLEAAGHRLVPTLTVPSPAGLAELIAGSNLVRNPPAALARELPNSWSPVPARSVGPSICRSSGRRAPMHQPCTYGCEAPFWPRSERIVAAQRYVPSFQNAPPIASMKPARMAERMIGPTLATQMLVDEGRGPLYCRFRLPRTMPQLPNI